MTTDARPLAGLRLLLAEDELLVAADLGYMLEQEGATILGPADTVARGLDLLEESTPDAAVLDLKLAGEVSSPLATALAARKVPFVIVTGYGESWMTFSEFYGAPVAEKPVSHEQVIRLLDSALASR